MGIVNPAFFRADNLFDVLRTTSYSFIIAAPLTLLMIVGQFTKGVKKKVFIEGKEKKYLTHLFSKVSL